MLSPHQFQIPHHRRRLFIVACLKSKGGLKGFEFPEILDIGQTSIKSIIDNSYKPYRGENLKLSKEEKLVVRTWERFIKKISKKSPLPGFPIWSHEWGATYPYEYKSVRACSVNELIGLRGTYGLEISGKSLDQIIDKFIPRYSQKDEFKYPKWKIRYIEQNREFYKKNKSYIDNFMNENPQLFNFEFSYQKLEWSCQGKIKNI